VADDSICSSTHHDSSDSMPVQRNAGKLATGQVRSRQLHLKIHFFKIIQLYSIGQKLTAFPNHKAAMLFHFDYVNNLVYLFTAVKKLM